MNKFNIKEKKIPLHNKQILLQLFDCATAFRTAHAASDFVFCTVEHFNQS